MLESDSESAKNLCWRRQVVPKTQATPLSDLATNGTIPSHGEDGENEKTEPVEEMRESEPLAVVLVNAIFHLLFLPEFTIEDPKVDFSEVRTFVLTMYLQCTYESIAQVFLYFFLRKFFVFDIFIL